MNRGREGPAPLAVPGVVSHIHCLYYQALYGTMVNSAFYGKGRQLSPNSLKSLYMLYD